jgi:cytochrome d ubiquinol oxidase subunit II
MIVGGIASGRVPVDRHGGLLESWTGPTSWIGGTLAVVTCAFLAAVFLAADAERAGDGELAGWIGRRALVCGIVTGAVALAAVIPLATDADTLANRLRGRAVPVVAASALAGVLGIVLLQQRRWATARWAAVVAVAAIVVAWGVAQYPYLLTDQLTLDDAAGARTTLVALVVTSALLP